MPPRSLSRLLTSPEASCAFAVQLAALLRAGDVVLLSGEIGAGKTHIARCAIQSMLDVPEDVPSPTFTIVQVYDTPETEIWHCDLYRLSGPDEIVELGLDEAFDRAICFVEWPDRLGAMRPEKALEVASMPVGRDAARNVTLTWTAPRWDVLLEVCHE